LIVAETLFERRDQIHSVVWAAVHNQIRCIASVS
jgi:hypothetical protein